MGCNTSAPKPDEDLARRRLSVAPNQADGKEDESKEDERIVVVNNNTGPGVLPHAVKSKKGVIPYNKHKVNQDRAIVQYLIQNDPGVSLWGCMDGHGEYGNDVASFVQEKLPLSIQAHPELKYHPEKALTESVKRVCDDLCETDINVAFSGTTLCFGLKIMDMLYVSNVGDSRCVMCRQGDSGELQAIGLSIDQKPDNPKEKARILKAGGRVEPLPGPPGEDCGPPRVWLAEVDVPGLAMSRSIGDEVSQTVGVISVPEIIPHQIQSNDIFAIWATDGVWEFLSNEQAISIVWKYKHDLTLAADQLIEEATKMWRKEEEVIDDITVIIVMFNQAR